MPNKFSMDLLEALRSGMDADTLIRDFQEQMMDAQMAYEAEQKQKMEADYADMNLQAIRENLAHDFLDYICALGIMPGEKIGKNDYEYMVEVIKQTEDEMKKMAGLTRLSGGLGMLGRLFK